MFQDLQETTKTWCFRVYVVSLFKKDSLIAPDAWTSGLSVLSAARGDKSRLQPGRLFPAMEDAHLNLSSWPWAKSSKRSVFQSFSGVGVIKDP